MRLIFRVRPFAWMFYKNWYSLYRWKNGTEYEGEISRIIDMGSFSFGYAKKLRNYNAINSN